MNSEARSPNRIPKEIESYQELGCLLAQWFVPFLSLFLKATCQSPEKMKVGLVDAP